MIKFFKAMAMTFLLEFIIFSVFCIPHPTSYVSPAIQFFTSHILHPTSYVSPAIQFFTSHILHPTSYVYAAVPHLISYQGRLTDSEDQPIDGEENIAFEIYDAAGGGTRLWGETHTGVLVEEGVFSVILGSQAALNLAFDKDYYLQIIVGDDPMTTRQRITSAGYALRAETADDADTLDGKHAAGFVNLTENQTISGAKTITATSPATPTPNTLYSDNLIKAWAKINSSGTLNDGFNIASVSRTAMGRYTINWQRPFVNDKYAVVINYFMSTNPNPGFLFYQVISQSASSVSLRFHYGTVGDYDPDAFYLIAIGDQ